MAMSNLDLGGASKEGQLQELARCLRQERIHVNYEKKQLQCLNESFADSGRRLAQAAWIANMQRENLEGLVLSRQECSPHFCCQRSNLLLQTEFVDSYKQLSHHVTAYTDLLVALRNRTNLLAVCLAVGDKVGHPGMNEIVVSVFSGLLGSCLLSEDEKLMMEVLKKLVDIQLISAANPRKLLRHGNSSLSRLYKAFSEQLFSSKLFLTSALFEPILHLLTDDEIFLDIDPSKAVIRFPAEERLRRFGQPGTDEYDRKLKEHRKYIIGKLAAHARRFITGIQQNFCRFPPHLASIMRYLFRKMTEDSKMESKDVYAVCVDLIFTLFICPAIVDPEPMGIIDMPISYIARFNLMQVAQMIQVLALWQWEEISPQVMDLYSEFERETVSKLVETVLEAFVEPPILTLDSNQQNFRLAVLLTVDQLQDTVDWLRMVMGDDQVEKENRDELSKLLHSVPANVPGRKKPVASSKPDSALSTGEAVEPDEQQGSPATFARHKNALAAKLSNVGSGGKPKSASKLPPESVSNLTSGAPERVLVIPIHDAPSELPGLASEETVLRKCPVAMGGGKLKMNYVGFEDTLSFRDGSINSASGEVLEKRTRFSLSHDEGSIGNTSDNLEAISEAASNHSVASSLEDEVDPVEDPIIDNLSDMVSANVSGRGTPNVSGRDTPSSQVTEEDEVGQAEVVEPQVVQVVNIINRPAGGNNVLTERKNGEPDMEERFGRFEIKPEVRRGRVGQLGSTGTMGDRDEAVSMVSDTWSTDVLSSDTETIGEPPTLEDLLRGRPGDEFNNRNRDEMINRARNIDQLAVPNEGSISHNNSSSAMSGGGSQLLDVGETNSEAWSMDVLASDTESFRMRDFDPDDSLSVARSDDTTRSDPDHLMQRLELAEYEEGSVNRPEARVFIPVKNEAVEKWAEQSRANSGATEKRRDSDASANSNRQDSILKKPQPLQVANLSEPSLVSLDESTTTDGCSSVENFSIGTGDMSTLSTAVRVSNTSIASSASSHGSAASVEAAAVKSRSNSSVGGPAQEELKVGLAMASTGAIPKSISFDKSADKDEDGEHKIGGGSLNKRDRNFFKNWKLPKIGRNRGGGRGSKNDDYRSSDRLTHDTFNIPEHAEGPVLRRVASEASAVTANAAVVVHSETSDDILAKYRKPERSAKLEENHINIIKPGEDEVDGVELDLANLDNSVVFQDAKRKLRLMLSEVEMPLLLNVPGLVDEGNKEEILGLLRVMLAQAINQQDRNLVAQLYETIRCLSNLDQESSSKLTRTLRDEYRRRAPYIAYLVRSRQGLLSSINTLQKLTANMESEQRMCSRFLITVCVRLFIERHERELRQMQQQFSSSSAMDEKTDLVVRLLEGLWLELERDPVLAASNAEQRELARIAVERSVFSQIYMTALYPNGEADISRDKVLQVHVEKLREKVTPGHKDLKIPRSYQYECPWPSAQAELKRLAAFKLPSDKVSCVSRVATTVMNLLSLAADKSVPAADDFLPVFVYVIIQANPPGLLSTVQFVDNFFGSRLSGEDQYWWMQFTAAIEFIKTMD